MMGRGKIKFLNIVRNLRVYDFFISILNVCWDYVEGNFCQYKFFYVLVVDGLEELVLIFGNINYVIFRNFQLDILYIVMVVFVYIEGDGGCILDIGRILMRGLVRNV